jgi:hypothetical protein
VRPSLGVYGWFFNGFRPAIVRQWWGIHLSKGPLMNRRYFAIAMATLLPLVSFSGGCTPSNDESVAGPTPVVTPKADAPALHGYADAVKYMEETQRAKAKSVPKKP